ncbi:beta-1,3-galactosyltransferase 1-like [Haliotis asinina]|uniref:beta-1,3-galactosyltransferase 1-like n=1 Tax=Haliotis asinina TaxID=109174 RepID=UPI003532481D
MNMHQKIVFPIYLMIILMSLNICHIFLRAKTRIATTCQPNKPDISRQHAYFQTTYSPKVDHVASDSETRNISNPIDVKETTERSKSDSRVRPFSCNNCFKHDFIYLIQNEDICSEENRDEVDLIMLILTSHNNAYMRNVVRSTWASVSRNNTGNVRYVFLLGEVPQKHLMEAVHKEAIHYKDMLMEDFRDSYSNLTYKTIMGLKWASSFCDNAKFVLKTDDDMWVNVPQILRLVNRNKLILQSRVLGKCGHGQVMRDRNSKGYITFNEYPSSDYPQYCSGSGYVISIAVAKQIYEISRHVPFLKFEDVYIGMCVKALGKVGFKYNAGFFYTGDFRNNPCILKSEDVLTCHHVPLLMIQKVMKEKC